MLNRLHVLFFVLYYRVTQLGKQYRKVLKDMLKKWMPEHVRFQLLILLIVHCSSYWFAKFLIRNRVHLSMALPIDGRIPFLSWTSAIYFGCFLFWVVNYIIILRTEPEGTNRFFRAELLGKLVCFISYVLLPTTIIRPDVSGSGVFPFVMQAMYFLDTPDALFPSMHCFVSWMCVIGLRGKPDVSQKYRVFSVIFAFLVFMATLTTKQHVVVDVIAGVLLAELVYFIAGLLPDFKSASLHLDYWSF